VVEVELVRTGASVVNLDRMDSLRLWRWASLNMLEVDVELVSTEVWETCFDNAEDPKEDCGVIEASDSGVSGARLNVSVDPDV
jgi:hypothetical protein